MTGKDGWYNAIQPWIFLAPALFFLGATGAILVHDLDRPDRFLYVLFRPNWSSWLVKGAYIIAGFGLICSIMLASYYFEYSPPSWAHVLGIIFGCATSIYTAFLLAQAKAHDLWSSKHSPLHMLIHAVLAGSAALIFLAPAASDKWTTILLISTVLNLVFVVQEAFGKHHTEEAHRAAIKITTGRYAKVLYTGLIVGGVIPLILLVAPLGGGAHQIAAILSLVGIYLTEFVRIRAPQLMSLI